MNYKLKFELQLGNPLAHAFQTDFHNQSGWDFDHVVEEGGGEGV